MIIINCVAMSRKKTIHFSVQSIEEVAKRLDGHVNCIFLRLGDAIGTSSY